MIKRFKEVNGLYIEKIYGQDRLALAMSDTSDLYDLVEYAQRGGYQGSVIKLYDFENGSVYTPFEKKRGSVKNSEMDLEQVLFICCILLDHSSRTS